MIISSLELLDKAAETISISVIKSSLPDSDEPDDIKLFESASNFSSINIFPFQQTILNICRPNATSGAFIISIKLDPKSFGSRIFFGFNVAAFELVSKLCNADDDLFRRNPEIPFGNDEATILEIRIKIS
ncbi:hypothetical protein DERP_013460 [Dermatophagoides pteronyssinus]|uniref:Uncharacterized protein n=1 Tax=Dermatophagoides pteronyssinus TaxID=6956 RepID=A0ABQ8JSA4_DERPT|nr:hypothetical protein DERP_013460 [Dermatophagoides pteronyssinus]